MEKETQRQSGFDREVRVLPLRAPRARSVRFPGGDGRWGQPEGDVASMDERAIVGGPVSDAVFRLVLWVDSRFHPSSLNCRLETSHLFMHQRRKPGARLSQDGLAAHVVQLQYQVSTFGWCRHRLEWPSLQGRAQCISCNPIQAAAALGVSKSTAARWISQGTIPA